ncbi:MAG: PIN domain-containing protein [Dehalococcoidia bacterium]|nr:PIN domain-containing protein [Dehalococcoidia bacterium]
MIYALDTNILSFLLRTKQNPDIAKRFVDEIGQGNDYIIPPMSYYEITWYLLRKKAVAQLHCFESLYQSSFAKTSMDESDLLMAAKIKANLEEHGKAICDADIFIAAYCIVNDYTLVTDNTRDFERINGLKFVNWKK